MKYRAALTFSGHPYTGTASTRHAAAVEALRLALDECNMGALPFTVELGPLTIDREPTEREKKIMEETMRRMGKMGNGQVWQEVANECKADPFPPEVKGEDAEAIAAQAEIAPKTLAELNPNPNEIEKRMIAEKRRAAK